MTPDQAPVNGVEAILGGCSGRAHESQWTLCLVCVRAAIRAAVEEAERERDKAWSSMLSDGDVWATLDRAKEALARRISAAEARVRREEVEPMVKALADYSDTIQMHALPRSWDHGAFMLVNRNEWEQTDSRALAAIRARKEGGR